MSFYILPLKAGVPLTQETPGKLLLLDTIGVANEIDITLINPGGTEKAVIHNRKAGFRHVMAFEGVRFMSDVDTTIGVFLSFDDVQLGFVAGSSVEVPNGLQITNDAAHRVPVDLGGAAIAVTVTDVGINNTPAAPVPVSLISSPNTDVLPVSEKRFTTLVNNASVAVGVAAVQISNDATLKKIVVRNAHASAIIAIGGVGLTLVDAAIILLPGDIWVEIEAPGANWYAISDTAATPVKVLGQK